MSTISKRVDDHVGACIRTRRTQLGMTQQDLGRALEMSYQQVQKYETGANRISAGRLYEIAQILRNDVSDFYDALEPQGIRAPLVHGGKNRGTIELVKNFTAIEDPAIKAAIQQMIKAATGKQVKKSEPISEAA